MTNTLSILIRPEQPDDTIVIEQVTKTAFLTAPHTSHTEHFIVRELRKHQQLIISLVAEYQQQIVGHVAISPVTLSNQETGWYGLAPVSIIPEMQGQGIGKKLIQTALQQLRQLNAKGCVLLGDPNYYSRFGFIADTSLVLADVPPEYFQVLSFVDEIPQTQVKFHRAFDATGESSPE